MVSRLSWSWRGPIVLVTLVAVAAIALLFIAGCGGDDDDGETAAAPDASSAPEEQATVDVEQVELELRKTLDGLESLGAPATIYPPGGGPPQELDVGGGSRLEVRAVPCPEEVPVEKDGEFSCEVDAKNGSGKVEVTQTDDAGQKFEYRAEVKTSGAGVTSTVKLNGKINLDE